MIRRFIPAPARRVLRDALPVGVQRTVKQVLHGRGQRDLLRSLVPPVQWCIDFVEVSDRAIEIRGWALVTEDADVGGPEGPPYKSRVADVTFTVDDRVFSEVSYPRPRKDIGRLFWYLPHAPASGFICRGEQPLRRGPHATLECVSETTGHPFSAEQGYYLPEASRCSTPLPDPRRMARVHGGGAASSFVLEGYSAYVKLEQALSSLAGKRYGDFRQILDWGCGCGRLTRYFEHINGAAMTGADIDRDNLDWCREHFAFGQFRVIPLRPLTDLPSATFDLILGVSVFTHLDERTQFEWLDELRRVSAPGALLLMTTHGNAAVCRAGLSAPVLQQWATTGFADQQSPVLDEVIAESGYYRDSFHTVDYVRTRWDRYFDIVEIIPGYIGNHQDLVVMRKR